MLRAIAFVFISLVLIHPAQAEESDDWNYTVVFPMIWAPDINGRIEGGGDNITVSVPFGDIVEKLNLGFMGEFLAEKGNWGYGLKLNYLRAEGETITDPVLGGIVAPSHKIVDIMTMGVADLLVGYRVHRKLRFYTGIRYLHTKLDLEIRPEDPGGLISISKDINILEENIFDGLLGVAFNHHFNDKWRFVLSGDVGVVGDNDRDYMVETALMYKISKLNNVAVGYRYLQIGNDVSADTSTGPAVYKMDFTQQGPTIGWVFTF
jgi:hypothetical protein